MRAVGIKQLKARLSEYVRLVRSGETVLVTERDEVVAELRPARRRRQPADDLEDVLDALAESGDIERASLPKKGWAWKPRTAGLPAGAAAVLLDEIRGDRDIP